VWDEVSAAPIHATPHFVAFFVPHVVVYASSQDFVETALGQPYLNTTGAFLPAPFPTPGISTHPVHIHTHTIPPPPPHTHTQTRKRQARPSPPARSAHGPICRTTGRSIAAHAFAAGLECGDNSRAAPLFQALYLPQSGVARYTLSLPNGRRTPHRCNTFWTATAAGGARHRTAGRRVHPPPNTYHLPPSTCRRAPPLGCAAEAGGVRGLPQRENSPRGSSGAGRGRGRGCWKRQ
jgi:hypothetical protein